MESVKEYSKAPLVLGIIGGILGIPFTLFSLAFANFSAEEVGMDFYVFLALGILGSALGLIFGVLSKKMPLASGILQVIAAIFVGITLIGSCIPNLLIVVLFLIGAGISFIKIKK